MTKMTNAMALSYILDNCTLPSDVAEKVEKMLTQVQKKASATGERKLTATQTENAGFKDAILDAMESGVGYTISELIKTVPQIAELSNQRVSAIVRQMKEEHLLTREEIKRKAYFTKVED